MSKAAGVFVLREEIEKAHREYAANDEKIAALLREYFAISDPERHNLNLLFQAAILIELRELNGKRNKN